MPREPSGEMCEDCGFAGNMHAPMRLLARRHASGAIVIFRLARR